MERHPVCMFLLQAIPHGRFGQVLLGGFRILKHGAYICNVFLKSTGFATKLGLMFLEPFLHCFIAGGAGNRSGGVVSSFSKLSSAGVLVPLVGKDGPVELGLF